MGRTDNTKTTGSSNFASIAVDVVAVVVVVVVVLVVVDDDAVGVVALVDVGGCSVCS